MTGQGCVLDVNKRIFEVPDTRWHFCAAEELWQCPARSSACVSAVAQSNERFDSLSSNRYDLCSDNHDEESPDTYLVLRKWYDLNSKSEYRCFVADRQVVGMNRASLLNIAACSHCARLLGISSRHPQPDAHIGVARVQQLKTSLVNFVCDQVLEQFPLESCTFNVSASGHAHLTHDTCSSYVWPLYFTLWIDLDCWF